VLRALPARRLVDQRRAAHGQIDDLGIVRSFAQGTLALRVDERNVERCGYALGDPVLHFRELRTIAIEPICPSLCRICGIDKSCVDAHGIADPAHAALQCVAYRQFATDLPNIDSPSLVGESRARRDHE